MDGEFRETLNKSTSEMKRKAHGTQNTRHNMGLVECSTGLAHQYHATQRFAGAGIYAAFP